MFTAAILFCVMSANAEPLQCEATINRVDLFQTEEQCIKDLMTFVGLPEVMELAMPPQRLVVKEVKCVEWKTTPQSALKDML